jgi:hypothetical protein
MHRFNGEHCPWDVLSPWALALLVALTRPWEFVHRIKHGGVCEELPVAGLRVRNDLRPHLGSKHLKASSVLLGDSFQS